MTLKRLMAGPTIPGFLNLKEIAASVRAMGSDLVPTAHQNVISHWYHSDMDADLIVWRDENQNIIKQQINVFGQVVEWNIVDGVKTGFLVELEGPQVLTETGEHRNLIYGANEIYFDQNLTLGAVHQAVELINGLMCISDQEKQLLVNNLKNNPQISSMDPKKFLSIYGPKQKPSRWLEILQKFIRRFFR